MPKDRPAGERSANPVVRYGPTAAVAVAAAAFVLQNTESARFDFLWFDLTTPLWLVLTVFLAVGVLIGWVAGRRGRRPGAKG